MTFFFFRHKEQAPHKYMQLEQKLRNDERLSEFFWVLVFDQTFRPCCDYMVAQSVQKSFRSNTKLWW